MTKDPAFGKQVTFTSGGRDGESAWNDKMSSSKKDPTSKPLRKLSTMPKRLPSNAAREILEGKSAADDESCSERLSDTIEEELRLLERV